MKREELISALGDLGYPLISPARRTIRGSHVLEVLGELAVSNDARLVEGFPVVLATSAQKGLNLDIETFLARQPMRSRKRRNLEKLLLVASVLLGQEKLEKPEGLEEIAECLNKKYEDLPSAEALRLDKGLVLSMDRLRNALTRYRSLRDAGEKERARQRRSYLQELHLSVLFSPKQREIISKKLKGEPLSKTEKEYYSRVVKKKLQALTDSEVRRIATRLAKK